MVGCRAERTGGATPGAVAGIWLLILIGHPGIAGTARYVQPVRTPVHEAGARVSDSLTEDIVQLGGEAGVQVPSESSSRRGSSAPRAAA